MELILIIQGILLILLVWRVVYLGNIIEKVLKFQETIVEFQNAQSNLNRIQKEIHASCIYRI